MRSFLQPPRQLLALLSFLGACLFLIESHAATVIISYGGGTDPTTQGWAKAVANTNVVGGTYDDNGTAVWRIYDPGLGRPQTSDPANNLYYQKPLTSTLLGDLLTHGWEYSATLSVPMHDPVASGGALGSNGDTWVGIVYTNPDGSGTRLVFGFNAGRTAQSQMIVSVNGLNGSSRTFDPGYQDVRMVYDPVSKIASAYINEVLVGTYSGNSTSAGSSVMYWGDNSSQTTVTVPRATYYESVSFAMIPEPTRLSLCGLGMAMWVLLHRKRASYGKA